MISSNQPVFPVAEEIWSVSVCRWLPNDKNSLKSWSDALFWGWDVEWQWLKDRKSSFSHGSAGSPQLSSSFRMGTWQSFSLLLFLFCFFIYFSTKERFQIESHYICIVYLWPLKKQCIVSMYHQVRTFLYLPTNSWVVTSVFSYHI